MRHRHGLADGEAGRKRSRFPLTRPSTLLEKLEAWFDRLTTNGD
jgi:hypothetical protein